MSGIEIALLASSAVAAAGSVYQGVTASQNASAQAAAANYQAQVNERQAEVAKYNAQSVAQQAAAKEEAQRRHFAMLQGQTYAGLAQSGTDLGSGSNLDVIKQNELNSELDALNIRYEGGQKAASYTNTATNLLEQADLNRMSAAQAQNNASSAMIGGFFNAGSNLLSGYTKYAYYSGTGKLIQ